MSEATEKAEKNQKATGSFILWYCVLYTVASAVLAGYVFLVLLPNL